MKISTLMIGGAVGVAVLWSGGWFLGKTMFVEPEADKAVERLRSGNVFFSFDERTISGYPFAYDVAYKNVQLSDGTQQWRWSAPIMQVGSGVTDAGALVLTPAPKSKLTIEAAAFGGTPDGAPAVFDVTSDQMTVRLSNAGGGLNVVTNAASLNADQVDGASVISDGKMRVADLDLTFDAAAAFAEVSGVMTASEMEVGYRISIDGVAENTSAAVLSDVELAFEGQGMDVDSLADFIASDGTAKLKYTAGGYTGSGGSSGGPSAAPLSMDMEGGLATAIMSLRDGRVVYTADVAELDYRVKMEGPVEEGAISLANMAMRFEMPVRKSPEPGAYGIVMTLSDLVIEEPVWALVDPGKAIPRTPMNASIDLGGNVRLLRDFGEDSRGQPPVDVETLDIRDFAIDGAGVTANMTGALNIAGNASLPDGNMKILVNGAFTLIDQMAAGGIIPPEAAGFYKTIAQSYAKPGEGEDDLVADIEVKNGAVTINGLPLQ